MRWPWQPLPQVDIEAIVGAVTVPGSSIKTDDDPDKIPEAWQGAAWKLWVQLGELYFPTKYLSRQVSRLDWDVLRDGELVDREQSGPMLDEVTIGLGVEEASRLIALNLLVAGDGDYLYTSDQVFEVLSVIAPKRAEIRDDAEWFLRFYDPDPRDTRRATSSLQPATGPAEELVTLGALSRAQSRSRIAQAGVLLTPVQAKFGDTDPFGEDLETAMTLAIGDVDHPAAMVPIHVEMDKDLIPEANGGPRHMTFDRPYDDQIDKKIQLATRRIALALDMPAELLLGLGDINHWGAWLISEETYTAHVGPLATQVGEVFARAWEQLHEEVIEVIPDPSELLARRSSVRDAFDAYELGLVSQEYVLDVMGADEDDASTPEDIERLQAVRKSSRDANVEENPGPATTGEAVGAASTPTTIDLDSLAHDLAQIDVGLRGELIGAVEQASSAVREKLGSRARSAVRSDPVLREKLAGLPLEEIGSALGLQQLLLLGVEVDKLVDEGMSRLARWWSKRVPLAYGQVEKLGVPVHADFDALAHRSSEVLTNGVSKWLIENLDRDQPLALPTDVVRKTVATAGGQ